ncbi:MAG: mechanosensitive ion channel family protein [Sandaracinaceae bacterium]|nr:mechanosensitive ion channel family protein [Sandaracinaceae bacterium]
MEFDPLPSFSIPPSVWTLARIVGIGGAALLLRRLIGGAIQALGSKISSRSDPNAGMRFQTLARALRHVVDVVTLIVAGMLILSELGISIAPILATAGVAGVAIGFGAQAFVRDYLGGLLILVEDQMRQGEVVRIGNYVGTVEELTLRFVRLRDMDGKVVFIPNGEIKIVENLTREFARPLIDIRVPHEADVERAIQVIQATIEKACTEEGWAGVLSEPEVMGVQELGASSVVIRARVKVVPPIQQWAARRFLLQRIKRAFDQEGIEIPITQIGVTIRKNESQS